MNSAPRLRASRFVLAATLSAVFVLSAPFIGQIRSSIRAAFPQQFVRIVGALVAVVVIAAAGAAVIRIRERRTIRYGALSLSVIIAAAFTWWHATGRADVDVVELFHFVEYGLVTLLFYRAWRPLGDLSIVILPFLCGMLVGILDEWLQWFIPARVGEMNDVFLNSVAIGCGLLFSIGLDPPPRFDWGPRPGSLRRIGRFLVLDLVAFAGFFHVVHLGYVVTDDETGSFVSRYSADALGRMDHDKREAWRVRPLPMKLQRVSREDQYMSEGVVHVQRRNEQWTAGNARAAWLENRILEKYFDAVLDAPSYVSLTGHRWSPEQRAAAAARVAEQSGSGQTMADGTSAYVSDAYPYPIFPWPKPIFWATVVALTAVVITATTFADRVR